MLRSMSPVRTLIAITGLVALLVLPVFQPAPSAVADRVEIIASPSGSGTVCTNDSPCSLEGARAQARRLSEAGSAPAVVLLDGTYRLTETFALTAEDSGVTYTAAHAGKAVLDGGVPITTDWTANGSGWKTTLPDETKLFHDLFDNGVAQTIARFPNAEEPATNGPWRRLDASQPTCVPVVVSQPETHRPCERKVDASGVPGGPDALVGAQLVLQGQWR